MTRNHPTQSRTWLLAAALLALCGWPAAGCEGNPEYAKVFVIEDMAQTIGGPAAAARPGDFLLENDRLRAVVHGRHNLRSTMPISNGSLVDLDIQRPLDVNSNGRGRDAFYELGPMVNFKVGSSATMGSGPCESVGAAPCPEGHSGCVRVTGEGRGENIMGTLGLLDLAIERKYPQKGLHLVTDYDLCPGESFVRVSTTARFYGPGEGVEMEELAQRTGLMDVLLGEHTGRACVTSADCAQGESCDKLLVELKLGTLNTEMRRCRRPQDKLAGVLAGDFILFSAKVAVFIPGSGFDHESYIRSVFDTGGDVFSAPLSRSFIASVGPEVSYVYFNATGEVMIPVFAEAFTASMTNRHGCGQATPECFKGKELRFHRYVSVGHGDVASALAGYYQVRGIATGQVEGHVIDARTQSPLSRRDVFVFALPQTWESLDDAEIGARGYDALLTANQAETRTGDNPAGEVGLLSHFRTDVGPFDFVPDGSFSGPLPAGRYVLVARDEARPVSGLHPIRVSAGSTTRTSLSLGDPGALQYEIQDPSGRPLPSKLTIGHCFPECARDEDCSGGRPLCDPETRLCVPRGGYVGPESCRPDQTWGLDARLNKQTCICPQTGLLQLALGGHRFADGTIRTVLSATGAGEVKLEPGAAAYQVIASRGLEYEVSRQFVSLLPATVKRIHAVLPRVVDTQGYISADFHVHGPNSVDSGLDHTTRVLSYAAEGVELLTATDHDFLTDYGPTIKTLGLQAWLKSQTGLEVSPLDYGHFIGFPLRFDQNEEQHGAFHWRASKVDPAPEDDDWRNLTPSEIFKKLRELGSLGVEKTVVFVAHFYDHFTFYGVDPWTLEAPFFSISALFNEVLLPRNFSGEFDALEALNGKNLDIVRRPTYQEIRDYNLGLSKLLQATEGQPYEERLRQWGELSAAAQREFLRRTKEEQAAAIRGPSPSFVCRCAQDAECGPGSLCDETTAGCIPGCASDGSCDATLVAAGREQCLPVASDPARRICKRVSASCAKDEDCTVTFGAAKEKCLALDPASPVLRVCALPCTGDSECKADPLRPTCDTKTKTCVVAATGGAPSPTIPCPTVRGTVDDWFVLLNRGIRRPILGNSDSHGTYGIEAGIPRNYVRSETDLPQAIRPEEVAAAVKHMQTLPTYGPFVELTLNGEPVGSTVSVAPGEEVTLGLKVQSPTWFDVDRIEIYRNGELIREIGGKVDCPAGSSDCIAVPNRTVVNYQGTIRDTPEGDAWYVVAVMGLDGKSLAPVYSSTPVARLGIYELIQRLTPLLPPLRSFRTPLSPSMTVVRPYAITNPIWVDVGGDGLTPLLPFPSWATPQDRGVGSESSALHEPPTPSAPPAPSHDHRRGLGKMRMDAAWLEQMTRDGTLSERVLRQALDGLRYSSPHH
jgi:hypothetical protein